MGIVLPVLALGLLVGAVWALVGVPVPDRSGDLARIRREEEPW